MSDRIHPVNLQMDMWHTSIYAAGSVNQYPMGNVLIPSEGKEIPLPCLDWSSGELYIQPNGQVKACRTLNGGEGRGSSTYQRLLGIDKPTAEQREISKTVALYGSEDCSSNKVSTLKAILK